MKIFRLRYFTQTISSILQNSSLGFLKTKGPFTGVTKSFCSLGLNCYSCPLAWFSCPLGIIQNLFISIKVLPSKTLFTSMAYSLGFVSFLSLLLGRFTCGWLCPFGFLQELLYRIPFWKKKLTLPGRLERYGKHLFLIFFVILLPFLFINELGYGILWFCKYICPAGTLEAGFLNLLLQPSLFKGIGLIFYLKVAFFLLFVLVSLLELRFFCKNLCPLGLVYGFFNRVGLLRLRWKETSCSLCGACDKVCPMNLSIPKELNSVECIRCLNCLSVCSAKAITLSRSFYFEPQLDHKPQTIKELKDAKGTGILR